MTGERREEVKRGKKRKGETKKEGRRGKRRRAPT